jgi:hypothetical protein
MSDEGQIPLVWEDPRAVARRWTLLHEAREIIQAMMPLACHVPGPPRDDCPLCRAQHWLAEMEAIPKKVD